MSAIATAGRINTADIDEHRQAVDPWDVVFRQMAPGRFEGTLEFVQVDEFMVYREHWSKKVVVNGAAPAGFFMFGSTLVPNNHISWCGSAACPESLAFSMPASELDFIIPTHGKHVVLLAPESIAEDYAHVFGNALQLLRGSYHVACNRALGRQFIRMLDDVISRYINHPQTLSDPGIAASVRHQLLDELTQLLACKDASSSAMTRQRGQQIFRAASEYIHSTRAAIPIPELAAATHVSPRSLERAFSKTVGVSPIKYIRWHRMNGVFRELARLRPSPGAVSQTALKWGFSEFGRFSGEYSVLFGENPSMTLASPRNRYRPRLAELITRR